MGGRSHFDDAEKKKPLTGKYVHSYHGNLHCHDTALIAIEVSELDDLTTLQSAQVR